MYIFPSSLHKGFKVDDKELLKEDWGRCCTPVTLALGKLRWKYHKFRASMG